MARLQQLADRMLKLQTPDKLRLAAAMLEQTNDVRTARIIIQRALDELTLFGLFDERTDRDV